MFDQEDYHLSKHFRNVPKANPGKPEKAFWTRFLENIF